MSVMAEPTMTEDEREAEKQDAAMEIGRIGIQIKLLEAEASDPVIKAELEALRSKRAAAESRLHELLGVEREERLTAEAEAVEAEARRQAHVARASELGAERLAAARAVDSALRKFASALADHERIATDQARELYWAGNRQAADIAKSRSYRIGSALRFALREARVPSTAIELPPMLQTPIRPLVEQDPRAVEPS